MKNSNEILRTFVTIAWAVFGGCLISISLSVETYRWFNLLAVDDSNKVFLLILGTCSLYISIFSHFYFSKKGFSFWVNLFLFFFVLNVAVLFLAKNLFLLAAAFEFTTIFSWILIIISRHREASLATRFVVALTLIGGIAFIAFCSVLANQTGSFEVNEAIKNFTRSEKGVSFLEGLLVISILSKSAIFPFSVWLVRAMVADAPISALLHSATLVKIGLFVGFLFFPILSDFGRQFLTYLGAVSALYYAFRAFFCDQLKIALAFSTLSSLGVLSGLLGLGLLNEFLNFLATHAFYKSVLFLAVGLMVIRARSSGIQDLARSFSAPEKFLVITPLLSLIGLWPFGSLTKEILLETVLHDFKSIFLILLIVGAVLFSQAFGFKLIKALLGKQQKMVKTQFRAIMFFIIGFFWMGLFLLGDALSFPDQSVSQLTKALSWFLLAVSLVFGFLKSPELTITPTLFVKATEKWLDISGSLASYFQSQKFQVYVFSFFAFSTALISLASLNLHFDLKWSFTSSILFVLLIIAFIGGYLALRSRSRVLTVVSFALTGLSVNFSFLVFGAPDLAITSFLVDLIWLALFILALSHLPPFAKIPISSFKGWAFGLSVLVGVIFFWLSVQPPQNSEVLKGAYLVEAERLLSAKNAVNAIVTGFRGIDTVGEIIVLLLAALGFKALMVKND